MPTHYDVSCTKCNYRAKRYRNAKVCPECGGDLKREAATLATTSRDCHE